MLPEGSLPPAAAEVVLNLIENRYSSKEIKHSTCESVSLRRASARPVRLLETSRSHASGEKVVLRRHTESVRYAIEKREHCDDVYGFRDLILAPACITQLLYVRGGGLGGSPGDQLGIIEQSPLGRGQSRLIELALENCRNALVGCSLNTQEVGVAVESIRAPIQERDVTRKHLFVAANEMTLREMHGVREFDYLAQEVRPRAEAFDDSWNLMPAGTLAPEIVGRRRVAGGLVILGDTNLCGPSFGRRLDGLVGVAGIIFFAATHMRQTS
jgi:hypothetical protein